MSDKHSRNHLPSTDPTPPLPDSPPADGAGWISYIIDSNPLYLISVLLMVYGLMLVSEESLDHNISVQTVVLFFGIQNLYEIVVLAMAIFLLRNRINQRHGKMLLIFIMAFAADLTGYLVRISAMDSIWGMAVGATYLTLAVGKIAAVVYFLDMKVRWERLAYPISAFAITYFAPLYLYHVIDTVGKTQAVGAPSTFFSGHTEVYLIWFVSAFIMLPTIVGAWRENDLEEARPNPAFGNEQEFYWALLLVPFFVLPYQLFKNIMADATASSASLGSMEFVLVPYLLLGGFFLANFFRSFLERVGTLNLYDFAFLVCVGMFAFFNRPQAEMAAPLMNINWSLFLLAHIAVALTRQNVFSATLLVGVVVWWFGGFLRSLATRAVTQIGLLSRMAWACILMASSFALLGLGFLFSLRQGSRQDG